MAVRSVPVSQLIITFLVSLFWGTLIVAKSLWDIFKNGRDQFFHVKDRKHWHRPKIMDSPDLGTHGFLKLSEVKIHYVANEVSSKPLMLLVHGFPECWFSWRFQMQHFMENYRVVAIDMRGYGESDKPSGMENYVLEKLSNDLKEVVTALGYEKCVLVTHDWGGAVGFHFTIKHPDMVDKFVVCNAPHPRAMMEVLEGSIKQFLKSWYIYFFQLPFIPELRFKSKDFEILNIMFNGQILPGLSRKAVDPDELEAYKWSFSQPGGITCPINYYRALFRYRQSKLDGYEVKVPTLIIWGTQDQALSTDIVKASSKYIANLQVKHIPVAGHWVQQQEPDRVNQYIEEFLS